MQTRRCRYPKRLFDVVGAAIALAALAAPMLVIAWAIRRDGTGPALFAHVRVGRDGREFRCLKFRTMRCDAEEVLQRWQRTDDPLWHAFVAGNYKLERDPRVTPIGRWLRGTSLDELPQLFNVLRGQMSLVGPRPVTAAELAQYGKEGLRAYLSLTPGMTGLWQVSGRSDTTFARRVALDLQYREQCSFALDVCILLRTVRVVLGRRGAF